MSKSTFGAGLIFFAAIFTGIPIATLATALPTKDASPASLTTWSSAVEMPSPPQCKSGERAISPTSAITGSDGITTVTYKALPGLEVEKASPTFDPKRATAEQNERLNIPARPTAGDFANPRIRAVIDNARSRAVPTYCFRPIDKTNGPIAPPARKAAQSQKKELTSSPGCTQCASTEMSSNWSGVVLKQSSVAYTMSQVTGAWIVQKSLYNYPHNKDMTWIGIGGAIGDTNSYGLIQAGTSMETEHGYRSWFEWVGTNAGVSEQFANLGGVLYSGGSNAVNPNDTIFSIVYWQKGTAAQKTDWMMCFTVDDLTNSRGNVNGCQPRQPPASPQYGMPIPYDHFSMEWIDEQDTAGYPLSDFWETSFFDAGSLNSDGSIDPFTKYPYVSDVLGTDSPLSTPKIWDRCRDSILAFPANAAPMNTSGTPEGSSFTNQFCGSVYSCIATTTGSGTNVTATAVIDCLYDHMRAFVNCTASGGSPTPYYGPWIQTGSSVASCPTRSVAGSRGYQRQATSGGSITTIFR